MEPGLPPSLGRLWPQVGQHSVRGFSTSSLEGGEIERETLDCGYNCIAPDIPWAAFNP